VRSGGTCQAALLRCRVRWRGHGRSAPVSVAGHRSRRGRRSLRAPRPRRPSKSPSATVQVTIGDDADDGKYAARRVDKISRKCFPLAFLLFNLAYWILYALPGDADTSKSNSRS